MREWRYVAYGHDLLRSHTHALRSASPSHSPSHDYEYGLTSFAAVLFIASRKRRNNDADPRLRSTLVANLILRGEGFSSDLYRKFIYRIGGQTIACTCIASRPLVHDFHELIWRLRALKMEYIAEEYIAYS